MGHYKIILCLILNLLRSCLTEFKDEQVIRLEPKGFRISFLFDDPDITEVYFNVNIIKPIQIGEKADFKALITESRDGVWTYDHIHTFVGPGTPINYWIDIPKNGTNRIRRLRNTAVAMGKPSFLVPPSREECAALYTDIGECERSLTTVGRKPVCKGALIFEEDFTTLDPTIWTKEIRIPMEDEGSPFVSYQNRSENCYIEGDKLHIVPTLLSDVPGFNESMIQRGKLHLEDCKPMEEMSLDCERKARFSQILPPIVSARINTKRSFSFRYGKITIRAKMPQGDWLFPLMTLNPVENFYCSKNQASGQMVVAFTRGNGHLGGEKYKHMSNKYLFAGTFLPNRRFLGNKRLSQMSFVEELGKAFHDYTLTWKEDEIRFSIDGFEYGAISTSFKKEDYEEFDDILSYIRLWRNGDSTGPFDREFYLTLGVAAGGHVHFPEVDPDEILKPWKNGDPKAMLMFWNDRDKWLPTWRGENAGLLVDYVKVYAL